MKNSYKMCPLYILPHWSEFKAKVQGYLNATTSTTTSTTSGTTSSTAQLYRVRKTWNDAKSQIGAYASLENAKKACKSGYSVFDNSGSVVYTKSYSKGTKITLNNATLYASATATSGTKKSGTFYVYDGQIINGRMRITTKSEYCSATPVGQYVTGWVKQSEML
jgi:hypothetical protein